MCQRVLVLILLCGCAQQQIDEVLARSVDQFTVQKQDAARMDNGVLAPTDGGRQDFELNDSAMNVSGDSGSTGSQDALMEPIHDAFNLVDQGVSSMDAIVTNTDAEVGLTDAMVEPSDMMVSQPPIGFTLCGVGMRQRVGVGTWDVPIKVGRFPFVDRFTTVSEGESRIDVYDCAPNTGEYGREVVYAFELEVPGDLVAEVRDDGASVDIDLHLLRDHSENGREVVGCIGRAHTKKGRCMKVPMT
jgi:hypothetical protein